MSDQLIELHAITKTYGQGQAAFQALRGIDLTIAAGEFVAVMGPSGSGKSTAMNLLGCLDTPTSGEYRFRGHPCRAAGSQSARPVAPQLSGFRLPGLQPASADLGAGKCGIAAAYRGEPAEQRHVSRRRR